MAAALIGCIEPFDASGNDWETYAPRLEQYLDANSIREEKKVATLLTLIGGTNLPARPKLGRPSRSEDEKLRRVDRRADSAFCPCPSRHCRTLSILQARPSALARRWLLTSQNLDAWCVTVTSVGTSTFPSAIALIVD